MPPIRLGPKKKSINVGPSIKTKTAEPIKPKPEPIRLEAKKKKKDTIDLRNKPKRGSVKEQIQRAKDLPLGDPRSLQTTGTLSLIAPFGIGAAGKAATGIGNAIRIAPTLGKSTLVIKAGKIGAKGKVAIKDLSGGAFFKVNPKTVQTTTNWLKKLGVGTTASILVGAIGSYPFAGFIKEEALQTLSFGVKSALDNGDIEGAETAIAEQEELLNPGTWDKVMTSVPYANVVNQLKNFYDAARTKLAIDKEVISQMRIQAETGETESEKWDRIDREREERKIQIREEEAEYFKQVTENQKRAKKEARAEEQAYWAKVSADRQKRKEEERKAEEEYWANVRIESDKRRAESGFSNLQFGLL